MARDGLCLFLFHEKVCPVKQDGIAGIFPFCTFFLFLGIELNSEQSSYIMKNSEP